MPGNRLPAVLEQVSVVQLDGAVAIASAVARAIRTCRSFPLHTLWRAALDFQTHIRADAGLSVQVGPGYRLSDVRTGDELSSFRSSCSANRQNSSSLPSGLPLRSQIS
jgi:hypothetical protein